MSAVLNERRSTPVDACRLEFSAGAFGTRLEHASAGSPWRVLRAPTASRCEPIVVQTRGGLIDGDRWRLSAHATHGARARLCATGATIVYSGRCFLRTTLRASTGAWLAQRSSGLIVRSEATLRATTVLHAQSGGTVVASEAVALRGRGGGILRTVVMRDGETVLDDRLRLDGAREGSWALAGFTHVGTLIAVGPRQRVRAHSWARSLPPNAGVCRPRPGCVLVRMLASSIDEISLLFAGLTALTDPPPQAWLSSIPRLQNARTH